MKSYTVIPQDGMVEGGKKWAGDELKSLPLGRVNEKHTATRAKVVVLKQLLNLIPRGMINRHALETGVEDKVRSFSVLIQLSAMLFAQLSHVRKG